jgi:predicted RNase H-like HicB family nuclease
MPETSDVRIREVLDRPYSFVVTREEDGRFAAKVAEFPGCVSEGEDRASALRNLEQAAYDWVSAALEDGYPIPPAPSESPSASGRFLVRLPKSLHARLQSAAVRDQVSLNQYVLSVLAGHVGAAELAEHVTSTMTQALERHIAQQAALSFFQIATTQYATLGALKAYTGGALTLSPVWPPVSLAANATDMRGPLTAANQVRVQPSGESSSNAVAKLL